MERVSGPGTLSGMGILTHTGKEVSLSIRRRHTGVEHCEVQRRRRTSPVPTRSKSFQSSGSTDRVVLGVFDWIGSSLSKTEGSPDRRIVSGLYGSSI